MRPILPLATSQLTPFIASRIGGIPAGRGYFPRSLPLLYLTICVPTILFLIFFRQPLGSPDELSHASRAYQLSRGVVLTEEAQPGLHPKGMVDDGLFMLGGQVGRRRFESLRTALPIFQKYGWTGKEDLRRFNSSVYFPVPFIPQAIAFKIARELKIPLVQSLQLASFLNAMVCLAIIAFAIHIAAEGKYLIAFIGTLPMTLHQMASPSPDGMIIAASLLMAALAIAAVIRSKVTPSALIGVVATGALVAATKLPYLPLSLAALFALWLMEPRSFRTIGKYATAVTVMIAVPLLWIEVSNASTVNHSPRFETDPATQIAFLLSHPLDLPGLALSTFATYGKAYLMQVIGVLGWLDAPLPRAAFTTLCAGLIATLVLDGVSAKPMLRWTFLAAITASAGLILLSLYLTWNPLYSLEPVRGIQGRYFLPLLPFLAFLVPKLGRLDADGLKLWLFTVCGLIGQFATMAAIMRRYYL